MNGPSAQALREGGTGGNMRYTFGVTVVVRMANGGAAPPEWKKKTTLQGVFGEFGQVLRIDVPEGQGAAYVEYDDKRDAEDAARSLKKGKICGKDVEVQMLTQSNMSGGRVSSGTGGSGDLPSRIHTMGAEYGLDEPATARLISVFQERVRLGCDLNRDIEDLSQHLANSNKPSALVSMKLADWRTGQPIGQCKFSKGGRGGKGGGKGSEGQGYERGGRSDDRSRQEAPREIREGRGGRDEDRDLDRRDRGGGGGERRERSRDRRDRRDRSRDRRDRSRDRRERSRSRRR